MYVKKIVNKNPYLLETINMTFSDIFSILNPKLRRFILLSLVPDPQNKNKLSSIKKIDFIFANIRLGK